MSQRYGKVLDDILQASSFDKVGRSGINSIFGGSLMVQRQPIISVNFMYGVDTRRALDLSINGGSFGFNETLIYASSGTASNGSGVIETARHVRYRAGADAELLGTLVFNTPIAGNRQLGGLYDSNDGFAVGYEETDFAVFRKRDGSFVDIITQDNFNIDKLDGTGESRFVLNPQKINVYRIVYGYLGIATIYYEIYDGSKFIAFHKITLTNTQEITHIKNPYLNIRLESTNFGNTTDIQIKSGSVYAGIINGQAQFDSSARRFATSVPEVTLANLTNEPIIVFHNKATFNSIANHIEALLARVTIGTASNKPVVVKLYRLAVAPTLTAYTDIDAVNSIMEIATGGDIGTVDFTGAEILTTFTLGLNGQINSDVSDSRHLLPPDGYAVFSYDAGTGINGELIFGNEWDELF